MKKGIKLKQNAPKLNKIETTQSAMKWIICMTVSNKPKYVVRKYSSLIFWKGVLTKVGLSVLHVLINKSNNKTIISFNLLQFYVVFFQKVGRFMIYLSRFMVIKIKVDLFYFTVIHAAILYDFKISLS